MLHYIDTIMNKGSLDGYSTKISERLHIDYAKEAYRAGNQRDYIANMMLWLQRQEAFACRTAYLDWLVAQETTEACRTEANLDIFRPPVNSDAPEPGEKDGSQQTCRKFRLMRRLAV